MSSLENKLADAVSHSPIVIRLPKVTVEGSISLEATINNRRSRREYNNLSLTLDEVGQLLWAAQGSTEPGGSKRAVPSAGALFPLEFYLAVAHIEGLKAGIYKYSPGNHVLIQVEEQNVLDDLSIAALNQECVRDCSVVIVFVAVYERTTQKYGERGIQYVHIEVGHAAQNVFLQAESLGLGTVVVGAFSDQDVHELMGLERAEQPLYMMPVGRV